MVTMLTAHTEEMDNIEAAVRDIMAQIAPEANLRAHSAGLLTCYPEFIETGVVKALCNALPFDVVGCTTLGSGTGVRGDMMMSLNLTVLTSDDLLFSAALTGSLEGEQKAPIAAAYRTARAALPTDPCLVIPFMPMIRHVGGEILLDELRIASGDVPIFGTVACDHTVDYREARVIYNGESCGACMGMLLIAGDLSPRFMITSISEDKTQKHRAIITASEGNILMEVNDMPLLDYLESLGLSEGNGLETASAIPFVVDFGDGTKPSARAIYLVTDEGHAICGGDMPVNATLAIGSLDYDDVMETTRLLCEEALAGDSHGVLTFSCLSRNLILGADIEAELSTYSAQLSGKLPHMMAYAGGEICPVYDSEGKPVNRFHNFTAVACVL